MDPGEQGTARISGRRRMVPFCTSAPDGARCAVAHDTGAARVADRIEKIVTDAIYAEFTMCPAPPSHAAWLPITRAGGCRARQSHPFIHSCWRWAWSVVAMPCGVQNERKALREGCGVPLDREALAGAAAVPERKAQPNSCPLTAAHTDCARKALRLVPSSASTSRHPLEQLEYLRMALTRLALGTAGHTSHTTLRLAVAALRFRRWAERGPERARQPRLARQGVESWCHMTWRGLTWRRVHMAWGISAAGRAAANETAKPIGGLHLPAVPGGARRVQPPCLAPLPSAHCAQLGQQSQSR